MTSYIDADARDPGTILSQAGRTLDFAAPVAVIMMDLCTDSTRSLESRLLTAEDA